LTVAWCGGRSAVDDQLSQAVEGLGAYPGQRSVPRHRRDEAYAREIAAAERTGSSPSDFPPEHYERAAR
jgi:hypothetical protein